MSYAANRRGLSEHLEALGVDPNARAIDADELVGREVVLLVEEGDDQWVRPRPVSQG